MNVRGLHRRIGWAAGFAALAWAATGFLHPIMSWTAPRAAVQAPPEQTLALEGLIEPAPAFAALGVTETTHVRLAAIDGAPIWLAATGGVRAGIDARTGAPAPLADQAHAVALARHYAGLPEAPVARARLITAFCDAYPSVNRLLPVWEVRFATRDGLTAFVDTGTDRLASVVNDPRRAMLAVFQNVHTLKWLEPVEPVRIAAIFALVGATLAAALLGAGMLLSAQGRGLRRAHAWLAWAALPAVAAFAVSGLFHLVMTSALGAKPAPTARAFALSALAPAPTSPGLAQSLSAVALDAGAPLWRLETESAVIYPGARLSDAIAARRIAGAPREAAVERVDGFSPEYGFINKRLPVMRVETAQGAVFVDVREGLIAGRAAPDPLAAAEAWSFDHLHKAEFLRPLGRLARDGFSMALAAIIAATAALGLMVAVRSRRRRAAPS